MRLCNETITVFNAKLNKGSGSDVYYPTVIVGASWHCEIASSVDPSTGLKAASKFTIRIPEDADFSGKTYVSPLEYAEADPAEHFTLKNGDIIVKGVVEEEGIRPAALKEQYGEIVTVLGITDNRRAARSRHWKVIGA